MQYYGYSSIEGDNMDWDELRGMRDTALSHMDKYQLAIPYSLLDNTQQAQLQLYRQALLDLPNETSTPEEALLNMPTKPDWMD